jgi:hypothetical protein
MKACSSAAVLHELSAKQSFASGSKAWSSGLLSQRYIVLTLVGLVTVVVQV